MINNDEHQTKFEAMIQADIRNEMMALGHMLQNEEAAILAAKVLNEKHFATTVNAYIFKIIKHHVEKGELVNKAHYVVTSITEEDWKKIDARGLVNSKQKYIADCFILAVELLGNPSMGEYLISRIKDQYMRREGSEILKRGCSSLLSTECYSDFKESFTQTIGKLEEIIDQTIDTVAEETFKELALNILNQKQTEKINTGFVALDEILGGFGAGQLITIGAATSVGKSAFAVNLALNICNQESKVALWSFEMDKVEIMHRIFSIRTGFSNASTKNNNSSEEYYNAARKYIEGTSDDIKVFTRQITNLGSFYLDCRRLKLTQGVKVVIIDYLQLIHLTQGYENNRVRELETITNTFKNIASELEITIIILSQLSREVHKREGKKPILSDLRDSGSIEQDSNVVMLLCRSNEESSNSSQRLIEVNVAKNRSGKTGTCTLKYIPNLTKFSN